MRRHRKAILVALAILSLVAGVATWMRHYGPSVVRAPSDDDREAQTSDRERARRENDVADAGAEGRIALGANIGDGGVGSNGEPRLCREVRVRFEDERAAPDVLLLVGPDERTLSEQRTDAEGRARVCAARGPSFAIDAWDDEGRWASARGAWQSDHTILLVLVEQATVTGIVRDERRAPIAGAHVRPQRDTLSVDLLGGHDSLRLSGREVWTSGSDGRFEIAAQAGARLALRAEAEGFETTVSAPFETRLGQTTEVEITMRRGATIEGVVLANARPVQSASVLAMHDARTVSARTDSAGRFVLGGLVREQTYSVVTSASGYLTDLRDLAPSTGHRIELQRGASARVRAHLPAFARACPSSNVNGRFRIPNGAHAGGIELEWDAWLDVNGLEPGRQTFVVTASNDVVADLEGRTLHATRDVDVRLGMPLDVDMQLEVPRGQGFLEVVVNGSASVLPETHVSLESSAGSVRLSSGPHVCGTASAGHYTLVARAPGFSARREIDVAGASHQRVSLTLQTADHEAPDPMRCCAPLETIAVRDRLVVVQPSGSLSPGELITSVGGQSGSAAQMRTALCGPSEGTVSVSVRRRDSSTATVEMTRDCSARTVEL